MTQAPPTLRLIDTAEVRRALDALIRPGQVVEVRALDATSRSYSKPHTISGYFDRGALLIDALKTITGADGVYVTFNPCDPALLARVNNRLSEEPGLKATQDKNIIERHYILIDNDPLRGESDVTGIPATEEEHQAALSRAQEIQAFLTELGAPLPIEIDSGNGAYLLYQSSEQDTDLVKKFLTGLASTFKGGLVKVDTTTYSPAQLMRLPGTWNSKGDGTPDRPARQARIISLPDNQQPIPRSTLEAVAAMAEPQMSQQSQNQKAPGLTPRLDPFLARHPELQVGEALSYNKGGKRRLAKCPFCHNSDNNAYLFDEPGKPLGFHCSHNSCKDKHWHEWREWLEPAAYSTNQQNGHKPEQEPKERTYQLQPLSYLKNRPKREWAVDHILLDKGVSVFVGDGGSGKSTFVLNMDIARACHIDFIDKVTKPAFVIWVAAESLDELYDRIIAMLRCNDIPEEVFTNFLILDGRMPFNNTAEVDLFIKEVQEQLEGLGVSDQSHWLTFTFDTYARCTPGANENDTQETKIIVDSMLKISDAFSAQVKTIHHVNAQGRIRGNTAFRDAVDTMWVVSKDGSQIKLHCDKMRGRIEPGDFQVEMRSIVLDQNNLDWTAPVIFPLDAPSTEAFTPRAQMQMLEILQASGQLSSNTWAANCEKAHRIPYSTFHIHRKHLLDIGLVEFLGGEKPSKGKRTTYVLSKAGEEVLG